MRNESKNLKNPALKNAERRIVKVDYEHITRVIEFRIFVVRPDGEKARALGGGAFEEQDLERVAAKLSELARDFALSDAETAGLVQEAEAPV